MMMILRSLTKPWAWCHCGWIQVVAAWPPAKEEEGEWAGTSSEEGKAKIKQTNYGAFYWPRKLDASVIWFSSTSKCTVDFWVSQRGSYLLVEHQIIMTLKRLEKYMEETRRNIIFRFLFIYLFLNSLPGLFCFRFCQLSHSHCSPAGGGKVAFKALSFRQFTRRRRRRPSILMVFLP